MQRRMGNLEDSFFQQFRDYHRYPDGRMVDLRYRFSRGTKVVITGGPYNGCTGTVESCVFLQGKEDEPGYHVTLDEMAGG